MGSGKQVQDSRCSEHHLSPRWLTVQYVGGLLLIGCIALASLFVQQHSIEHNRGLAAVINLSGRQRMLSQRMAGLSAEYLLGDPSARPALQAAAAEFEAAHRSLSTTYLQSTGSAASAQQLRQLYFGGSRPLDEEVREFIDTARGAAALSADDPALPKLVASLSAEARAPLLNALNQVVSIHQLETERRLAELAFLQRMLLVVMGITLALEALLIFQPMVRTIVASYIKLTVLATTDWLTGAVNRRGFDQRCQAELDRVRRHPGPMCIMAIDADHFKRINDTLGHHAGDEVLRSIGATLLDCIRPIDILGRIGGEEFAIVLPETTLGGAMALAERIRTEIAETQIAFGDSIIRVTVSIGVARIPLDSRKLSEALQTADKLLYQAKQAGRNCVAGEECLELELQAV